MNLFLQGDNIMEKLRSQLPADISCQVESVEEFRTILEKEDSFAPFGELIAKFSKGDNNFEVFRSLFTVLRSSSVL